MKRRRVLLFNIITIIFILPLLVGLFAATGAVIYLAFDVGSYFSTPAQEPFAVRIRRTLPPLAPAEVTTDEVEAQAAPAPAVVAPVLVEAEPETPAVVVVEEEPVTEPVASLQDVTASEEAVAETTVVEETSEAEASTEVVDEAAQSESAEVDQTTAEASAEEDGVEEETGDHEFVPTTTPNVAPAVVVVAPPPPPAPSAPPVEINASFFDQLLDQVKEDD